MEQADQVVPIAELLDERGYLLDVAYRMLGSSGEAESVVEESYRRWYGLSEPARAQIAAPRAWLGKVAGDICLARLARRRPTSRAGEAGAAAGTEPHTSVEEGNRELLLSALHSLSPAGRTAFLLNDVSEGAPSGTADIVGEREPECTDPADRARHSLRVRQSLPTTPQQHDALARAVRHACATEDAVLLTSLLAPEATAFFDGGGKVRALVKPVHGNERIARTLLTLLARHPRNTLHTRSVNGRTGLVLRYDQQVVAVISLDTAGHHVVQVWAILNPDKLRSWNRTAPAQHRQGLT